MCGYAIAFYNINSWSVLLAWMTAANEALYESRLQDRHTHSGRKTIHKVLEALLSADYQLDKYHRQGADVPIVLIGSS